MIELVEDEKNNLPAIKKSIDEVVARMAGLVIDSDEKMIVAAEWLKENKATQKIVTGHFTPLKREVDAAKKALLSEEKTYLEPLEKGERAVKALLSAYEVKREAARYEERMKAEAVAKRLIEERVLETAIETGDESALDAPIEAPVIPLAEKAKVEGVSYVENWTFEITDANLVPREYLVVDEKMVRQVVRALKGAAVIPGVRVYSEKTVRAVA